MYSVVKIILFSFLPVLFYPQLVVAQEGMGMGMGAAEQRTRRTPAMRQRIYETLSEAQELMEMDETESALEVMSELRQRDDLNSYEVAQMWNFYAFIYFAEDNFPEVIRAYEMVLAQPDLPLGMETTTRYTLCQLFFQREEYERSMQMLDSWFALEATPGPDAYVLKAQLFYQMEQWRNGIEPVDTAISIAKRQTAEKFIRDNEAIRIENERRRDVNADGGELVNEETGERTILEMLSEIESAESMWPVELNENWYRLLNVFYYELDEYDSVITVLRTMIELWPKRDYFVQLSGIYGQEGNDEAQLSLYQTAYEAGWLERGTELVTLSQLLLGAGIPIQSAYIMEEGLSSEVIESTEANWRVLSQAWQLAQENEKAIPALSTAANLSDNGELDIRLAQAHQNLLQWDDCIESARTGLRKGDLRREDQGNMILGACLFEISEFDAARTAFTRASQDTRSRTNAESWIQYVNAEEDRELQLQAAMADL